MNRRLLIDRRHPRHAFPCPHNDAFLLHLQGPFRARLPAAPLRPGQQHPVGRVLRLHDRPHERHQHVFHGPGHEGRPGLGHPLQHLGLVDLM